MVKLKKSIKGRGEKLAGRNLLFPTNSIAFSAKNLCLVQQEREQQQQEPKQMERRILAGDIRIDCHFNSLFNLAGPKLS